MSAITSWILKYGISPNGIIHVGARVAEELGEWDRLTKRVSWVEANPDLWEPLKKIVNPYGHEVICAAAGPKVGTVRFNVSNNDNCSSILPLGVHKSIFPQFIYTKNIEVPMTTLDEAFKGRYDQFDYLAIDTQGYEGQVLQGAETLLKSIRWIYCECNFQEMYVGCWLLPKLTQWLSEHGLEFKEQEVVHPGWGNALFMRK